VNDVRLSLKIFIRPSCWWRKIENVLFRIHPWLYYVRKTFASSEFWRGSYAV